MSLKSQRCSKHPSHLVTGVCSLCLTERLSLLSYVQCAPDSNQNFITGKHSITSLSARPSFAVRDLHPPAVLHHGPSSNSLKGSSSFGHRPSFSSTTESRVASVSNGPESSARNSILKIDVRRTFRGCDSLTQEDKHSLTSAEMLNVMTSDIHSCSNTLKAYLKKNDQKSSASHNSVFAAERHRLPSAEMSNLANNRRTSSQSTFVKNPSCNRNNMAAEDVHNLPSAEILNVTEIDKGRLSAETEIIGRTGHISAGTKNISAEQKSNSSCSTGCDDTNNCSREKHLQIQSTTDSPKLLKDVGSQHLRASSSHCKKSTLSSLFILDDVEDLTQNTIEPECMQNDIEGEPLVNGTPQSFKISEDNEQRRSSRHRSLSERADPSKYLFPVPEDTKNSSWFSLLLRRIKKSPWTKSAGAMAMASEHQKGWEHARQSWDAPRPSTWEQLRFSSFEGPSASSRPSWDGVIQFPSEDPVLNGIDFCIKGSKKVKEGSESPSYTQAWIDPKRIFGSGSRSSKSMSKAPHWDDKEVRTKSPSSTKYIQTVSAQTTPPRLSDSVEIFLQQKLNDGRDYRHYGKTSLAVWGKVWAKTFSSPKWAFKSKHEKE